MSINKIKTRELTLIIVITIILVLFFTGYSIGKGLSNSIIETDTEIAEPILVVENGPSIDITAINNKGYYDFKVKNYDEEGKLTQIDLEYTIEIISKTDESIEFKLYKDDEEISLNNNITDKIAISSKRKQDDRYKLEIMYDKAKVKSVTDIIQDVQIKVHSEQAKI